MAGAGGLPTYRKRPGCKNMGYEFELLMSMLLVLRLELGSESFNFTVHNMDAGDLDDIVFTVKDVKSKQVNGYFIQLKYTESKEEKNDIKRQELLEESGDFSLIRYYPSYLEIKNNFSNVENINLVIYTNSSMYKSNSTNNLHEIIDKSDDLIHTGGRIFTFTQQSEEYKAFECIKPYRDKLQELSDRLDKLKKSSGKEFEENVDKIREEVGTMKIAHSRQLKNVKKNLFKKKLQEVLSQVLEWDLQTWKEFMDNLKVYTDQLSIKELGDLVKEEYEELCGTSKTFLQFKKSMASWREGNTCLTKNLSLFWKDVLQMQRADLMSSASSKMKPVENLTFKHTENINIFENCPERIIQIVSKDSTEISCLKVQQSLSNADYLLVDMNTLRENLKQVLFVWRHYRILVILGDSTCGKRRGDGKLAEDLEHVLHSDLNKKIILITNTTNHSFIKCNMSEMVSWQEEFKFDQLTPRSQEIILDCQVDFQGHPVNLRSLVSNTDDITADVIVEILRREKVEVGKKQSPETNWEPVTDFDIFYIPRTLQRREIVDENIFKSTRSDCVAFSDVPLSEVATLLPDNTAVQKLAEGHEIDENCKNFIISETSSFIKLCEKYDQVHWIQKSEKYFVWRRSGGDTKLIRSHLKQNVDPVNYGNIRDVLRIPEQVILIVAEPGMGKTTEVSRLAKVIKEENHATWIIVVNLINYKDIFTDNAFDTVENVGNTEVTRSSVTDDSSQTLVQITLSETARHLLCRAGNFDTKFEENLFLNELSHGGNIVPIFNGFDEVSSDCLEKAIDIVKQIIHTNIRKVFITSRPTMQEKLENEFSCLAFSLKPLCDEDQIELLQNVWHVPGMSTCYDSAAFTTELQNLYEKCLGFDIKQFAGSPLHAEILGKVFKSDAEAYSKHGKICSTLDIDLLLPYSEFVDEKLKAYCKKNSVNLKNFSTRKNAEEWKNDSITFSKIYAVIGFLSENDLRKLGDCDKLKKEFEDGIKGGKEKLGMLQGIVLGKPVFVDKNLMAYFVALWLSENFDRHRKFIMDRLFDANWKTVRKFLDRILCKDFKLHNAILNQDLFEVQNLLLTPGVNVDEKDHGGRTPLHLSVLSQRKEILNWLIDHGADPKIKEKWFGWKPLMFAEKMNWMDAVMVLQKET